MSSTPHPRSVSIARIMGGDVCWYDTHKAMAKAEARAGVVWCGETREHKTAPLGAPMRMAGGSYARAVHGSDTVRCMTAAECRAAGVVPGPANL
jgi:hypothetical protein